MWSPTHVQVLVKKAKGLKIKGKDGTNDAFVTIGLGKEKYQTSVKEKATESVEWCEQCELTIPQQGNTAEIVLNVLHRNFLGVDEFLGMVSMPLRDFDVYERPKTKWYPLKCKPGQTKNDYRGELEVRTSFTVKAVDNNMSSDKVGSTADLGSKGKNRGSITSLNKAVGNIGGSLLSLGQKEKKHIKKLAKSVTHKVEKVGSKARKSLSSQHKENQQAALPNKFDLNASNASSSFQSSSSKKSSPFVKTQKNLDPGVNSDEEEDDMEGDLGDDDMFRFDALSHRSSANSINVSENMNLGIVSRTSTPQSGTSLENMSAGAGLPNANVGNSGNDLLRKTLAGNQNRKLNSSTGTGSAKSDQPVLDDWEQKLLGKKGVTPFYSSSSENRSNKLDTLSLSQISNNSSQNSRSNTLERPGKNSNRKLTDSLPRNTLPTHEETPSGRKKKIVPDFERDPSPDVLSSPEKSPGNPFENSDDSSGDGKKKKMGFRWKSSVKNLVDTKRSGSLFNLSTLGKGFREKENSFGKNRNASSESLNQNRGHSRTHSDGSGSSQQEPPSGTRVAPLGRETTPTPNAPQRIPREIWDRFEGKTREDLIEMIVGLQGQLEGQGKKQVDLEDYLDSLLMKVMAHNPELLQKNPKMGNNNKLTPSIK